MKTLPPLMSSRPAIMRRAVDFPQPDGPTKTTNSPSGISRFILSTAITSSPKTLVTSSRVTSAIYFLLFYPNAPFPIAFRALVPLYLATFYMLLACPAQAVPLLNPEYALDRLPDAGFGNLPRLDGPHDGVVGLRLLLRAQNHEKVGPRSDSVDRSIGDGSSTLSPRHREIVGDDHAVEAEIAAQRAYGIF